MDRLNNFVFTLNNYTEVDIRQLLCFNCKYIVFAEEVAPTTGTRHLQGYCELSKQTRFGTLIQGLPHGMHIEPRRGTQQQAIAYIKTPKDKPIPKNEHLYEVGEPRTQGKDITETALEVARNLLRVQHPIDPSIHNIGVIKAYERLSKYWPVSRNNSVNELSRIWIYGPGGSGKTRTAYLYTNTYRTYKCDLFNKGWFDGYDNHEAVILDDFNPDCNDKETFKLLLSILDRYPLRVNVKGSSVNWNPTMIIVTSQKPPWEYYGNPMTFRDRPEVWHTDEELRQLMRRIDLVVITNNDQKVKYPPVLEVASVVLPSNFQVRQDSKENRWQEDTEDSSDVEEGSYPDQDRVGLNGEQEAEGFLQEHPTSTPVRCEDQV
jgi:hypothetical protein